ncbi:hypothetical protein L2E82_33829 [Cichorium intybus]|uniref:Uncharacterized protein n=1 Tax=Cichorium intybus TaxID=13427 RepID=A0ACB9BLI3_CICIN|nr:hypothetical protein L2E82_33829 [Cichorium intybus]
MKATAMVCFVVGLCATMLLMGQIPGTAAVRCSYMQLVPCVDAITSSRLAPTGACCSKMREQRYCFCGYLRDLSLRQFVSPKAAYRIASQCGVKIPAC